MQLTKHRQHPVSQLGERRPVAGGALHLSRCSFRLSRVQGTRSAPRPSWTASSSPLIISRSSFKSYPGSGDGMSAIVLRSSLCVNGLRNTASNPSLSFSRRSEAETAITGNLRAQSSEAERIAESSRQPENPPSSVHRSAPYRHRPAYPRTAPTDHRSKPCDRPISVFRPTWLVARDRPRQRVSNQE